MDFGKLKLNEGVANGNLAYDATQKTSEFSRTQGKEGQTGGTQNSRERQNAQKTAKTITKQSPMLQTSLNNSYDAMQALRGRKELIKMREAAKYDWRKDLMEAANPNDDPNHPFVEVMPHSDYRMKEAKKNLAKSMGQDKMQQGSVTAGVGSSMSESAVGYADRQTVKAKKDQGKALPKGINKKAVTNADNTATPKENAGRRLFNANPQMKGELSKKALKGVETDAFDNK
jgi:hypothetical protein